MTYFKKWFFFIFFIILLNMFSWCGAAVQGDCSNCHTMHNSQQGNDVAFTLDSTGKPVFRDQAFANLLKTDCLGCHSQAGAETISSLGNSAIPIVFNIAEPTYPPDGSATSTLAGGNFHWVSTDGDPYGHNVTGIVGEDLRFPSTNAPGGIERTGDCTECHGSLATAGSGCNGCHVPHHHAEGTGNIADGEKGWYRFLGSVMQRDDQLGPPPEGVRGIEAADWEQVPLPNAHNVYQGSTGAYTSYLESGSISQKCVGCHGTFHSNTLADSTWIRHPVEVAIPDSGEFISMTTYNPLVPVARPNVTPQDAGFSVINRGSDMVTCVSCHRPHGSPYPAMLRWGYRDWPGVDSHTGQTEQNGCSVCHSTKS